MPFPIFEMSRLKYSVKLFFPWLSLRCGDKWRNSSRNCVPIGLWLLELSIAFDAFFRAILGSWVADIVTRNQTFAHRNDGVERGLRGYLCLLKITPNVSFGNGYWLITFWERLIDVRYILPTQWLSGAGWLRGMDEQCLLQSMRTSAHDKTSIHEILTRERSFALRWRTSNSLSLYC